MFSVKRHINAVIAPALPFSTPSCHRNPCTPKIHRIGVTPTQTRNAMVTFPPASHVRVMGSTKARLSGKSVILAS